ncbi:MAG: DMT family transporter [Bacteroidaceae bacterium]
MQNNRHAGYIAGILAAAFYGLNPLFALPLYTGGMDTWSILLFRYLLSLPMLGLMLCRRGISFDINRYEARDLFLLGMLMAGSSALLYFAYNHMDAGISSTILFVYPILTALLMAIKYHERMQWIVGACLFVASLGIYILSTSGKQSEVHVTATGVVLSILSALSYAFYLTFINKGTLRGMPSVKVTFYVLVMGCLMLVAGVCLQGHLTIPHGWYWTCSLGSALFPTTLSLALTGFAINRIGSTETAILGATEPVTAVIVGVIVFSEHISLQSACGILLIVVSVSIVVAKDKFKRQTCRDTCR